MKFRNKNESMLSLKFNQVLSNTSLTPRKMKEERKAFKHAMKKQSRRIDKNELSSELEKD